MTVAVRTRRHDPPRQAPRPRRSSGGPHRRRRRGPAGGGSHSMTASPQPGSKPEPQLRSPMASEPGHDVAIVPLIVEHWLAVERIYAAGIATGHATFESEPPSWAAFD